ncbi:MAG: tRNA lysidine(34) synthetase TilS [Ruminococcaceae bacterium]|nr:tRNA lysidine(34) synthetase TilS [Oscillospiraceae bacterium]
MDLLPWMRQWDMLPPAGGTMLCAVSGGRDSVCLLHYLVHLGQREHFAVAAAHLHHGQRPTAERDVAFVQELCRQLEIPCVVERADVPGFARCEGIGVEEAGRRLRYEFLFRTARELDAQRIATAHHADDQAETVLLQLLRGTGPDGLSGIPPVRGMVVRPLLQTPRSQIEAYLLKHDLPHVEDETNQDRSMARNLLRLDLLPQLEQINPALRENICRAADILREENTYLNQLAAEYLPPTGTMIAGEVLQRAPKPLRPRILRLLMDRLPVGKKDFGAAHYRSVLELTELPREGEYHLPGGVLAQWSEGCLTFLLREESQPEEAVLTEGELTWGPWQLRLQKSAPDLKAHLLLRREGSTVTVRCALPGDRLWLEGSRGSRSVKRLCVDRRIAPQARDRLPAICVDGRLAAVYGLGIDRAFVPTEKDEAWAIQIETKENVGGGKA